MFKTILLCLIATSYISCSLISPSRNLASINDISQDDFDNQNDEFESFIKLVEENLAWRTGAIDLIGDLKSKRVLTNEEIVTLHEKGTNIYKRLREKLYEYINNIRWIVDNDVVVDLKASRNHQELVWMNTDENKYLDGPVLKEKKLLIEINLKTKKGQYYANEIKFGLAAATILTDNYLIAVTPFENDTKLRQIINSDNTDFSNTLKEITFSFYNKVNFDDFTKAKTIFERIRILEKNRELGEKAKYLNDLISKCYTFKILKDSGYLQLYRKRHSKVRHLIKDSINKIKNKSTHDLSKFFGNTMGIFQSRSGKLKKMTESEQQKLTSQLKPLDILLEKTPFRLTDKFIPGHWGHVAIWTGNEQQLKSLDVWNELPELYEHARNDYGYRGKKFQTLVKEGNLIVEALRPGVQINSLSHFLDIDDLGVIRKNSLTKSDKKRYLLHAFKQIGKEYDFNFNVQSDKRIVCSELAYVVFNERKYDWPTDKTFGRQTISPDHVAIKAVGAERLFTPIIIFHKGKKINSDLDLNFERLLKEKYKQITFK